MNIRKICKYEFEDEAADGGTHDVEFIPTKRNNRILEAWVDGVFIECMSEGEKASLMRAWYYYEVYSKAPESDDVEELSAVFPEGDLDEVALFAH